MDTTLKQRILGIIVLVALLGICLSVLLHHNKNADRSRMPSISKSTAATPAIVSTTSSLLNSANSANMTPANTNVFDSDIPGASSTATPNTPAATQAASQPSAATATQSSAAFNEATPQSPSQPVVNNKVNPATVATSTIKPIARPPSSASTQDMTAQINATTANATATTNSDDAYASLPNNTNSSPATAIPTNTIRNAVAHKTIPHAHTTKAIKTTSHKKVPAVQHATVVNTAPHTAISSTQKAGPDFVVQVGSFTLPANAETLADKLRAKGFATNVQKYHTAQGDMTRVVVGKNGLDHTQTETLRHQLQTEMQINGFVVPQNTNQATTTISKAHHSTLAKKQTNMSATNTSVNDDI
jgi:cell division septation protein DedD